jgi:hypothetical protein
MAVEDRHELLVSQQSANKPHVEVSAVKITVGSWVSIGRLGYRKQLDIHEENAE